MALMSPLVTQPGRGPLETPRRKAGPLSARLGLGRRIHSGDWCSITLHADDSSLGEGTLSVDRETFIRLRSPGLREPLETFAGYTRPGYAFSRSEGEAARSGCAWRVMTGLICRSRLCATNVTG